MCIVKEKAHRDEPTDIYHLILQFSSVEHFCIFKLLVLVSSPANSTAVLVHSDTVIFRCSRLLFSAKKKKKALKAYYIQLDLHQLADSGYFFSVVGGNQEQR